MKRSEPIDFTIPQRQSYAAIVTILGKTIIVVARQILPLIAIMVISFFKASKADNSGKADLIFYTVIGVAILSMVYSIVNFFRTYFYLDGDELVLESGILYRNKISIPFDKIQTVDSEQSIIHRILNVAKVKVDTAGGAKTEFELSALDVDIAQSLRDVLIVKKSDLKPKTGDPALENQAIVPSQKLVMSLEPSELLRIGITENHLRSGWLIVIFAVWLFNALKDFGIDVEETYEDVDTSFFDLTVVMYVTIFFVVVSLIISLVRTVVRYYDLSFVRLPNGFKLIAGLFTRKEVSAMDYKIQYVDWSQNILQKIVGIHEMTLHQASIKDQMKKKERITIPGIIRSNIDLVTNSVFRRSGIEQLPIKPIDWRYFKRFATIVYIVFFVVCVAAFFVNNYKIIIVASILASLLIIKRYVEWQKAGYGYDATHIWVKNGYIAGKYALLPIQKIQAIDIFQSPFQRRHDLCNIKYVTAAGSVSTPYISYAEGRYMLDTFIYDVENSKKVWM
jgi:putative membrane protein